MSIGGSTAKQHAWLDTAVHYENNVDNKKENHKEKKADNKKNKSKYQKLLVSILP